MAPCPPYHGLNPAPSLRSLPHECTQEPQAAYFSTLDLPEALIHWGHPGNMAVVLLAMGGYGAG